MLPVRPILTTLAAAAALATALAAAGPAAAHSPLNINSVEAQTALLLNCKDDLGYRGDARLVRGTNSAGASVLRITAHDRIDAQEAAAVNDCADRRSGVFVRDGGRPFIRSHPTCPRHRPILYLGSAYCFKGR